MLSDKSGGAHNPSSSSPTSASPTSSMRRRARCASPDFPPTKIPELYYRLLKISKYEPENRINNITQTQSIFHRKKISISRWIFLSIYNTFLFLISNIMNKKTYYTMLPFLGAFYDFFITFFMKFCTFLKLFLSHSTNTYY